MPPEQYRTREAIQQKRRPAGSGAGVPQPPGGLGGGPADGGMPTQPSGRRGFIIGAIAAIAAVAIGTTVLTSHHGSSSAPAGFEFSIVTDPQQVADYLHHQNLPPVQAQRLEQQVKQQELVVWHVRQMPGWSQQQGQAYTMDNGTDHYQFTIRNDGQEFGVFAEKSATGFSFSADANPGNARMTGTWFTPAGRTPFDMQVGQTMVVRVK